MERRKLIEINRIVGQKRFIWLIGQHPVAQCVAQNGVGLTENADVLLGQRILKKRVAGAIQRIASCSDTFTKDKESYS